MSRVASMVAGVIVVQNPDGSLLHYPLLGWVVSGAMLAAMLLMYRVHQLVAGDATLQSDLRKKSIERAKAFEWSEHVDRIIDTARDLCEGHRQPVRGVEQHQC